MTDRTDYYREYKRKNRKRVNEYQRAYRLKHREKYREYHRLWNRSHRETRRLDSKRYNATPKGIYNALRWGCLRRKVPFEWGMENFILWYAKQPRKCFYCGVSEKDIKKVQWTKRFNRLTFDKIIPKDGYRENNVVLACQRCNLIKNDFFSQEEMLAIAKKYIRPKI